MRRELSIDRPEYQTGCVDTLLQMLWPPEFDQEYSGTSYKGHL